MGKQYWVQREDKTIGPFSGHQITQMAATGIITESDLISADQVNWQEAGRVGGLFDGIEATGSGPGDQHPAEDPSVSGDSTGLDDVSSGPHSQKRPVPGSSDAQGLIPVIIRWALAVTRIVPASMGVLLTILFFLPWLQFTGCSSESPGSGDYMYRASGWQLATGQMTVIRLEGSGPDRQELEMRHGAEWSAVNTALRSRPGLLLALVSPLVMVGFSVASLARRITPRAARIMILAAACTGGAAICLIDLGPDKSRYYRVKELQAKGAGWAEIQSELAKLDLEDKTGSGAFGLGKGFPGGDLANVLTPWVISFVLYLLFVVLNTALFLLQKWFTKRSSRLRAPP